MNVPAGATCPQHPALAAVDVCSRCGRFVCNGCALNFGDPGQEKTVCTECAPRLASLFSGSWVAVASAIVGFVSLGCGLLGPVAIVLGVVDLVRAARADGPRGGKALDGIGIALGALGTLIALAVLVRVGQQY